MRGILMYSIIIGSIFITKTFCSGRSVKQKRLNNISDDDLDSFLEEDEYEEDSEDSEELEDITVPSMFLGNKLGTNMQKVDDSPSETFSQELDYSNVASYYSNGTHSERITNSIYNPRIDDSEEPLEVLPDPIEEVSLVRWEDKANKIGNLDLLRKNLPKDSTSTNRTRDPARFFKYNKKNIIPHTIKRNMTANKQLAEKFNIPVCRTGHRNCTMSCKDHSKNLRVIVVSTPCQKCSATPNYLKTQVRQMIEKHDHHILLDYIPTNTKKLEFAESAIRCTIYFINCLTTNRNHILLDYLLCEYANANSENKLNIDCLKIPSIDANAVTACMRGELGKQLIEHEASCLNEARKVSRNCPVLLFNCKADLTLHTLAMENLKQTISSLVKRSGDEIMEQKYKNASSSCIQVDFNFKVTSNCNS